MEVIVPCPSKSVMLEPDSANISSSGAKGQDPLRQSDRMGMLLPRKYFSIVRRRLAGDGSGMDDPIATSAVKRLLSHLG